MRADTTEQINVGFDDQQHIDIIQRTRQIIKDLPEAQRMEKAKKHLEDALAYRKPRPDTYLPGVSCWLRFIYRLQTSTGWSSFLFLISYLFMYLEVLGANQYFEVKIILQSIILAILWLDVFAEIYHKSNETLRISSKFHLRFYMRIIILILLSIDIIIFASLHSVVQRPVRIFRILKGFLILFYDHFIRKAFVSLFSAYKDIIVYLFFYVLVIVSFGLIANQLIELPENKPIDQYTNDYSNFLKSIFVIYVLSTYDSYPDNQQLALQGSEYYYAIFIIFIFLNVFFFVVIPATLIFQSFRQTRSKIILIDQIKQQHSLILCFVSLGEEDLNITPKKLIRFLLYVYKNKVRYIDYIADVCLRLDNNNNGQIQISEFMNLCKILQANAALMPPMFHDSEIWLRIKHWMDQKIKLRTIVKSRPFKIITGIIIIFAFANSITFFATHIYAFAVIDDIIIVIFCIQIVLKILGLGPQAYFFDSWNKLDFFLILITIILQFLPSSISENAQYLSKMIRIFRITMLLKAIIGKSKNSIYIKIRQLFGQTAIILPIVLKFFPLFLITYFIYGIIGMQAFYQPQNHENTSKYAIYNQFSNFTRFLSTQYIMVQILVEAGWSMLAFDHSVRFGHYVLVMLYFVTAHMATVLILSSLLKGLVWQVYFTVHSQFQSRQQIQDMKQRQQKQIQQRKQEFQMVKELVEKNVQMTPDTFIMKQLYENKIDIEIMKKLKGMSLKASRKNNKNRSGVLSHLMHDRQINADQIRVQLKQDMEQSSNHLVSTIFRRQKRQQEKSKYRIERDSSLHENQNQQVESDDSHSIQDIQQLEEQIQKLITKTFLNPKVKYSEAVIYPKVFIDFITKKLIDPFSKFQAKRFDIDNDSIRNTQSLTFLAYEINSLLGIGKSQKEQKAIILQNMIQQDIINQDQAATLLNQKSKTYGKNIDVNRVIRNTFLGQTNQALIKKFEIQYFSDIYGRSFKEINKVTIEPLMKYQATLTYCLRNLLRYPKLSQIDFFTILTTIQDSFSNKLLKKGSLFKFVYQLDSQSGTWFSVQLKQSKQVRIHFIKSGIWIYNKSQEPDQILYGQDLFNWDISQRKDKSQCQKFMKRLYQSFESLAFCLHNQRIFLASSPNTFVYDLFSFYTDVRNVKRNDDKRQYCISKVMLVILSKQEQRTIKQNKLQYTFQSFEKKQEKLKKKDIFKFDQTQDQTYNKLKRLQVLDQQKILQTEGLPFAFVLNLMKDIKQMLAVNSQAITNQVQSIFNSEYAKVNIIPYQAKTLRNVKQSNLQIVQSKSQIVQPQKKT